ncbi:maleylacetate reductase [Pseudonocardia kongjuensis]|uniref:Maleylacetate reductase n=1 Tax=Pseudonocardia kongjuensis TaxID=102227 RepID=A0ABN1XSG0_9PSEU
MTGAFAHRTRAQSVRFAPGDAAAALAEEVAATGAQRVLVIAGATERALAGRLTAGLPVAGLHDEVVMHVPVDVADRARAVAARLRADLLVSVGGGSTTGLAKAVALTGGMPIVAVPTTYAGSEATDVWGLTEGAVKTTGVDPRVLPVAVVYDAELTRTLPTAAAVASGLNALAHCVDSMWAPHSDPIDRVLAAEGARALAGGLPAVAGAPQDRAGHEQVLYGAYLAAVAFASAGSGLHHKICHVLGGRYDLPHAPTHAVVLPHVLALNAPAAPDAGRRLAGALGHGSALAGLLELTARLGAPRSLGELGFRAADVPDAARAILPAVPPDNPATVTVAVLERLLAAAQEGAQPR